MPWSCTACSPIWLAISMTRCGASSRKTPTVTVSWGSRLTMSATAAGAIWRGDGAKMKPTASAPIPTASRASASLVIPQILTKKPSPWPSSPRPALTVGLRAGRPPPPRRSSARTRVSPTSTAWYPASASAATSSASLMPDSATATTPSGMAAASLERRVAVDFERVQVPLVDTDQRGPGVEGPRQLVLVVHLDQGVEGERAGQRLGTAELAVVERGGDEQDGVGTHRPGVADVEGADGEVLAQYRKGAGGPGGAADPPARRRRRPDR